ncbi:hypothetical protein RS130_16365 [Paraglaciecola aquimarina]|uniref:PhnB-like domain-containing protein n=1 Tax=Paraglaciecola aquimarina TaxID=1235557 RepID=A0ABU3SZ23_9ALTE|nr:hypothetical protein [Paraglaciecola aquimarina]MDU0355270.1 hypothetical protein [Paraglaciecola aquimarina]
MTLSLHINFNGSCREAFEFYQAVLNGKIGHMLAYKDSPVKQQTPKHWHDKILHGNICISGIQIAGADILPEHYQAINGVNLLIGLDSVNEVKEFMNN